LHLLTPVRRVDVAAERVSLSLRASAVSATAPLQLADMRVGMRVPGARIRSIQKYGLFLAIPNSPVTAFVHASEVSAAKLDLPSVFKVGTAVSACIIKVGGARVVGVGYRLAHAVGVDRSMRPRRRCGHR
jgi:ribosomal protein S1